MFLLGFLCGVTVTFLACAAMLARLPNFWGR